MTLLPRHWSMSAYAPMRGLLGVRSKMDSIELFRRDYAKWPTTYWVIGCYFVFCALSVAFAPATFVAHLPASAAFAKASDFPATVAFSMKSMLVALPVALLAMSLVTPIKLRQGRNNISGIIRALVLFVALGLIVAPVMLYFVTLNGSFYLTFDGKVSLTGFMFLYFAAIVSVSWISYIVVPISIFKIIYAMRA